MAHDEQRQSVCPICGVANAAQFEATHVRVNKCADLACGHLYAIDVNRALGIHEHSESNLEMYAGRNKRLIAKLLGEGHIKPRSRVLDIGSGLGHIMSELKRQASNIDVLCVEAAPQSVLHLKKAGLNVVEDLESVTKNTHGSFDNIFMVEVIEHLDNPVSVLHKCFELLNDDGVLFLTTPCGELRNGSHRTAAYEVREHVQFFTERSLRRAAEIAGFTNLVFLELREFHAGSDNVLMKWLKDSARTLRNKIQGRHHLIALIKKTT